MASEELLLLWSDCIILAFLSRSAALFQASTFPRYGVVLCIVLAQLWTSILSTGVCSWAQHAHLCGCSGFLGPMKAGRGHLSYENLLQMLNIRLHYLAHSITPNMHYSIRETPLDRSEMEDFGRYSL